MTSAKPVACIYMIVSSLVPLPETLCNPKLQAISAPGGYIFSARATALLSRSPESHVVAVSWWCHWTITGFRITLLANKSFGSLLYVKLDQCTVQHTRRHTYAGRQTRTHTHRTHKPTTPPPPIMSTKKRHYS